MRKACRKEGKEWGTVMQSSENLEQGRQKVEPLGSRQRGGERNIYLRIASLIPGVVPRDSVGTKTENNYSVVSA